MTIQRPLIVTHHAPDLDAITSTWLLKRFHGQDFADAKIAFVNPGDKIELEEAEKHQAQLHEVVYVDTGLGKFDHHQPERAKQNVCATTLVFDYLCQLYPDYANDQALKELVDYVNQIDHFQEISWPESQSARFTLTISELIRGHEFTNPHDDDSQMNFGFQCLDNAYASLRQHVKAKEIIKKKGIEFELPAGKCLAIKTRNDDTIKLAQKQGYVLVIRKDPTQGHVRIKARPDSAIDLSILAPKIMSKDKVGTWFLHGSGKMLLNNSKKHRGHTPSPLKLEQVVEIIKETYGESSS
ncbi:MAG: hypothetical protein ACOZAN_03075 [Patescibacteria group bacterium]